ncbi:hypothetical protein LI142_04540 [Eubacterium limosum]|uniref:hypothetical protein n=1 Tax=Eubacterium limosum TaxID=1736 RepID=UPI001D085091|nr:hypothetical protein [Eubacterium limosum]MCB6568771.1 hypothetical protein [Eubacterium limosum]
MTIYLKRITCFALCVLSVLLLTSIPGKAAGTDYSTDFIQSREGNELLDKGSAFGEQLNETQPLTNAVMREIDKIKEVYEPNTGIVAPPTVVLQMDEQADMERLSGNKPPQTALFDLMCRWGNPKFN